VNPCHKKSPRADANGLHGKFLQLPINKIIKSQKTPVLKLAMPCGKAINAFVMPWLTFSRRLRALLSKKLSRKALKAKAFHVLPGL
jgi:hypothetical protein